MTNWNLPPNRSAQIDQFAARLFSIHRRQETKNSFEETLAKVLRRPLDWSIDMGDTGSYFLKFRISDHHHTSEGLGEGLISLLFIVDSLYDSTTDSVVVIDEPELSLHPQFQAKLRELLSEYAKDRQIIYATHSPFLIHWSDVTNGARVARLWKENESCQIAHLSQETVKRTESLMLNLNNPHIFGLDATSVFFLEDGVILVEGQDDVVFYKKILKALGIEEPGSFFGWGVGGAGNMSVVAQILADLGFRRVTGILDSGQHEIARRLRSEFPSYQFEVSPAPDVRTKGSIPGRDRVDGLLDGELKVRSEFKEPLRELLERVRKYLVAD